MSNDQPSFQFTHNKKFHKKYGLKDIQNKWLKPTESDDSSQNHDRREVNSEFDALETDVKRNNLVEMFLRGTEVDEYISKRMYGF